MLPPIPVWLHRIQARSPCSRETPPYPPWALTLQTGPLLPPPHSSLGQTRSSHSTSKILFSFPVIPHLQPMQMSVLLGSTYGLLC